MTIWSYFPTVASIHQAKVLMDFGLALSHRDTHNIINVLIPTEVGTGTHRQKPLEFYRGEIFNSLRYIFISLYCVRNPLLLCCSLQGYPALKGVQRSE